MILAIRVDNYLAYKNKVELSMKANLKIKRLLANTIPVGNINVTKVGAIYGANNVGKTCFIRAIDSIKKALLGFNFGPIGFVNWFTKNPTLSLGITFTDEDKIYSYDFDYTSTNSNGIPQGFTYEKFSEIKIDKYGNEKEEILFLKDVVKQKYTYKENKQIEDLMRSVSVNNLLIYTLSTDRYETLEKYKNILQKCAKCIEVVDLDNIPILKTIQMLKEDNPKKSKIVELIKKADVDIDNYEYVKRTTNNAPLGLTEEIVPQERAINNQLSVRDFYYLVSDYHGIKVPSLLFDSTGTKKIAALASYIIEALEEGKTLVVDELDSSLHYKLTREIVILFNNIANTKGQLIFTTHDITLLDCKRLFRKDQIWFTSKEKGNVRLYSLDEYTAKDGIRAESDLIEQYRKGFLGAIPEPSFIDILLGEKFNA